MNYYSGLDVSLKTTFISVVDGQTGELVKEGEVSTDIEGISDFLKDAGSEAMLLGIESGQLSIALCKGLRAKGFDVKCVDARHMAAALSARINKNDKNDARGIAQMMRTGLYKEVLVKSDDICHIKVLLGSRNQLVSNRQQLKGTIRGLLKIWGIKLGVKRSNFYQELREKLTLLGELSRQSVEGLINSLECIEEALAHLDKLMIKQGKQDSDVNLLCSIPGVGIVTALTYKATLDAPERFSDSEAVGAYMGLTPRQYASGEINRHGSISKMGPVVCRSSLYEAAFSILTRCKKVSKLRSWGLKLMKKKGLKKAVVAVARKLSVIMHRMLVDKKEFCYS